MAITTLLRNLQSSINPKKLPLLPTKFSIFRSFTSSKVNTKVNFIPPNSPEDSEPEPDTKPVKLPPPYNPFNDKPAIEEPVDPKNLQEVFHRMRTEGMLSNAAKMFDEMSKEGLTHEALELFKEIKYKGKMPDVVAHTAVIEAYAKAGQCKEAYKVYRRMLSSGVAPNAYTYGVVINALVSSGEEKLVGEARKCVLEMLGRGMRVSVGTCVSVFEAFAKAGKVEEAKDLLREMKGKGFEVDEMGVGEVLKGKRGPHVRMVKDLLLRK